MASISSPEAATPLAPEARRDAYLERGKAHLAADRFHAAAVEFLAAHAIDPRSFWAPHLVGIAYEKSGSLDEAVIVALTFIFTLMYVALRFLLDVLYVLLDPRVRYG